MIQTFAQEQYRKLKDIREEIEERVHEDFSSMPGQQYGQRYSEASSIEVENLPEEVYSHDESEELKKI